MGLGRIPKTRRNQNTLQILLEDLYTRITGAKLGSAVGDIIPGGRGAGLVEAQAGSKYLKTLTQELPALQEMDALETNRLWQDRDIRFDVPLRYLIVIFLDFIKSNVNILNRSVHNML